MSGLGEAESGFLGLIFDQKLQLVYCEIMRKCFLVIPVIFASTILLAGTEADVPLGTYSGFSETHSTVAFELLKDGSANVTTEFYDGEREKAKQMNKNVPGTWVYNSPILTVTFGQFKDQFKK